MRALEDDRYVRQTDGYLPKANVAFVDEIFKANSAILNTLLTVLNERLFDNGTSRELVPLLCLVRMHTALVDIHSLLLQPEQKDHFCSRTCLITVTFNTIAYLQGLCFDAQTKANNCRFQSWTGCRLAHLMSFQKVKNLMPCMIDFSYGVKCCKSVMLACQPCLLLQLTIVWRYVLTSSAHSGHLL